MYKEDLKMPLSLNFSKKVARFMSNEFVYKNNYA